MFTPAISGERVAIGESVYSGKMGERVMTPHLNIWDDGIMPGGLATAPVDDEGTPSRRKPIVEKGVLRTFLYDIVTAKRYGGMPTGNAIRPGYNGMPHAAPRNLVLEGQQRPLDRLIASIDEGLLVNNVLGAHTGNLTSTEFSVNSTILFKIEKGAIVFPVASAMISGNLAEALSNVDALGDDRRVVPIGSPCYLPSVLFKGLRVTG
jgi:PmbA protein